MFECIYIKLGCNKVKGLECKDEEYTEKCPYAKYFKFLEDNFSDKIN